ncbi:hypothetical protein R3P38DRAFT_3195980 [Favolaschia claudopus]|uniref:Uncharacterized protein n=1 Tax=Favolaschia claudopus TaxID=2862362 RepID=A0AAW0BA77_9AGAR
MSTAFADIAPKAPSHLAAAEVAPPQLIRGKGKLPIVQVDGMCANCAHIR